MYMTLYFLTLTNYTLPPSLYLSETTTQGSVDGARVSRTSTLGTTPSQIVKRFDPCQMSAGAQY